MEVPASAASEQATTHQEECWALLQRVVASPQLRRAARMREFLQFVGQRTLKDGCDHIHEQEIGAEVFGRQAGYDTSVDNIVRVNATDLRKRVDEYFATDGSHESLIFEIPRGSYRPVFRQRSMKGRPEVERELTSVAQPIKVTASPVTMAIAAGTPRPGVVLHGRASRLYPALLAASGCVIVLLAVTCSVLWRQEEALKRPRFASPDTPTLSAFWSSFFGARPNTDVILADTSFSLIEDITKQPIPLDAYLNHSYLSQIRSPSLSPDRREDLSLIALRNYGSLGDFHVAQKIGALDPLARNIHLYYARDYTPPLLKQDNLILIGSRKSNPWVDLFASRTNFSIQYDPEKEVSFVKNSAPRAGEQAIYTPAASQDPTSGYSVVDYLPNPDQDGKVLIIAGTGSEATEGAGEFLASEDSLAAFRKLLHTKTLPYFEVVLKTTHLNSTPMTATVVAYRTYPNLH